MNRDNWVAPHFKPEEMECQCCRRLSVSAPFMVKLEAIRLNYGTMNVNSCCRCQKHNKDVKGAAGSSHLVTDAKEATAADIRCPNGESKYRLVQEAMIAGMKQIIVYNHFIHLGDDPAKPKMLLWGAY